MPALSKYNLALSKVLSDKQNKASITVFPTTKILSSDIFSFNRACLFFSVGAKLSAATREVIWRITSSGNGS